MSMEQVYGPLAARLAVAMNAHGVGAMIERDPALTETTSRVTMWIPDARLEEFFRLIESRDEDLEWL